MNDEELKALAANKTAMKAIKLIDRAASACHFGELKDDELCADIKQFRDELAQKLDADS